MNLYDSMLYPRETSQRYVVDLSGYWKFKIDTDHNGRQKGWTNGLVDSVLMAVPSSFNDIFTEKKIRNHAGDVWYERTFFIPKELENKNLEIRFGSATHKAEVWVNGEEMGTHKGGFMPFAVKLNDVVKYGEENTLVVAVNNLLDFTTLPLGRTSTLADGRKVVLPHFDFFNYAGLHRAVKLVVTPKERIEDITVVTDINGKEGIIKYDVKTSGDNEVNIEVYDEDKKLVAEAEGNNGEITINDAKLWQPGNAYLYNFRAKIVKGEKVVDEYYIEVGIRTVKVKGNRFLINGDPFYFKGFGKHEDSEYHGRGFDPVVALRDFELLDWINANSVRTSHYPYAEEFYQLADRKGIVVVDEVAAVGFQAVVKVEHKPVFSEEIVQTETLQYHKLEVERLIKRDKNHPCVVMWCLTNEPDSKDSACEKYFEEVYSHARALDVQNRPLTYTHYMEIKFEECKLHQYVDVIGLNRYWGWYVKPGEEFVDAMEIFKKDLDEFSTPGKPIIFFEYGADTMSGIHKLPSVTFSEEYQINFLEAYHKMFDSYENVIGEHVWNFADFQTTEGPMRVDGNKKGVFTRTRQPKSAAFNLKKRWGKIDNNHKA
ncbi:beta-glucuronidase [Clostridium sediminicola]|uniref:beta-glucuronidase n=1 Tax=Clostridium sediminicola TaxID=3114879 RepID=UPI0031F1D10B